MAEVSESTEILSSKLLLLPYLVFASRGSSACLAVPSHCKEQSFPSGHSPVANDLGFVPRSVPMQFRYPESLLSSLLSFPVSVLKGLGAGNMPRSQW